MDIQQLKKKAYLNEQNKIFRPIEKGKFNYLILTTWVTTHFWYLCFPKIIFLDEQISFEFQILFDLALLYLISVINDK